MATLKKQHLTPDGWKSCTASKRVCRYAEAEGRDVNHRVVEVDDVTGEVQPEPEVENPTRWRVSPDYVITAENKIESLNRRLEKAGVEGRFTYTIDYNVETDPETLQEYRVAYITLNSTRIKHNGWSFVGKIENIGADGENEFIYSTMKGESIQGNYDVDQMKCDHCGKTRHRNNTYIIKDEEGNYKQVGSNCLKPFMGVSPNLWAYDPDYLKEKLAEPDFGPGVFRPGDRVVGLEDLVATTLALTDGGKKYVGSNGDSPTKYAVTNFFFPPSIHDTRPDVDPDKYRELAKKMIAETTFDTGTDYGQNMNRLLKKTHVSSRFIGFAASVVPAYYRQQGQQKAKAEKKKYVGYVAQEGVKLANVPVKILKIKPLERDYSYNYYGVDNTLYTAETEDGKLIKWITSSTNETYANLEEGSPVVIKRGTVKGHAVYNDDEQTVLSRVAVMPPENN